VGGVVRGRGGWGDRSKGVNGGEGRKGGSVTPRSS